MSISNDFSGRYTNIDLPTERDGIDSLNRIPQDDEMLVDSFLQQGEALDLFFKNMDLEEEKQIKEDIKRYTELHNSFYSTKIVKVVSGIFTVLSFGYTIYKIITHDDEKNDNSFKGMLGTYGTIFGAGGVTIGILEENHRKNKIDSLCRARRYESLQHKITHIDAQLIKMNNNNQLRNEKFSEEYAMCEFS
jgi:hypothetical protein